MLYGYGIGQKHALKGLAQPQASHAGDVSAALEQGEACELARLARTHQARRLSSVVRVYIHASVLRGHAVTG